VLRDVGLEYIHKRAKHEQKHYMRHPMALYMSLNTFVQKFVERLNALNLYLFYFPEENAKQLDQDEIIEILDLAKARNPEWHEAMVNANIDIFEMTYEESVSYFKLLENFEKIRCTKVSILPHYHVNSSNHTCLVEWNDINKTKSWVNYDFIVLSLSNPKPIISFARNNKPLDKMPFLSPHSVL
jgi:hypothetical protein